jgi:hypothetical protein
MLEVLEFREERGELQALLESGIFDRAPHLSSFLAYICECYFEGQSHQLKEYTIGVEALKRTHGFDPKKDSIVRVEAHRLRRRLAEYYSSKGRDHRVRIEIPNGQYQPRFTFREESIPEESIPEEQTPAEPAAAVQLIIPNETIPPVSTSELPAAPLPSITGWIWVAALLLIGAFGLIALWLAVRSGRPKVSADGEEIWSGDTAAPVSSQFRMLSGYHGTPLSDPQGHVWSPDAYFSGGTSLPLSGEGIIQGQPNGSLLRSERSGEFHYDIPVTKGTHELRLYFAETEYGLGNFLGGGETSRLFGVSINGKEVIRRFDPIAEAGGSNRLLVRVFKDITPDTDGKIHIAFAKFKYQGRVVSPAFLNALEILQSRPGFIHPVRIVAQERPLTDVEGKSWSADSYFFGGSLAFHNQPVFSSRDETLYRGERYGNFAYHIPLAPGKYRVTLHFAETWFGTPQSNEPGPGSRQFDVYANGAALLQNFDIANEVGINREVSKVFDNLQPNAQGALWLEFVPVENYALINAIEVEETD